jgi:phosphoribosyl 1,2-cyclic phosphate phosphodiesterase
MARLKFTILGCGASPGVPRIDGDWGDCDPAEPRNRRTRCAALIERFGDAPEPTRVLIDAGPDIREQLLAAHVPTLDACVITHPHADHVHGVDDLRAYWMTSRRLLDVYADEGTSERLMEGFGYCFRTPPGGHYPPILNLRLATAGGPIVVAGPGGAITLTPFRQVHGEIDSLGLRVGRLAYSCDVSDIPQESLPALSDLDVWIVDALRYKPHPSHFSVDDALGWIGRVAPRRAILTHMHADVDYRKLAARLPADVVPAHDGMSLEIAE